jgi:glucose/arabinose dehydrogenase
VARVRGCLATVALAAGCALAAAGPASANVTTEPVGAFTRPVHVTAPPQDTARVFVVEQDGTVRVVVDGTVQPQAFLDISDIVLSPGDGSGNGERGLLSMAFAPDYATSRRFYVYFTDADGSNEVAEFRRSAIDPNLADPSSRRTVLTIPHPTYGNHNGGQLAFDAAGSLYVGTGDGGGGGDPLGNAQALGSLLGKILRIRPLQSGASPYTVPANPFRSYPGARPEIWAYGLRNPFRFSLDRQTGDLTIGDVGQNAFEEVDFVPRSSGAGAGRNFGWNPCEGRSAYPVPAQPASCGLAGHTPPVQVIDHGDGACSVIGGFVVRDASLEELDGRYVYGDFCKGDLRQLTLTSPDATGDGPVGTPTVQYSLLQSFGEDACGRIYSAEQGGAVSRLVDGSTSCTTALGLPPAPPQPPAAVPPAAPGPSSRASADRRSPTLRVRVIGGQRALRRRALLVRVRCDEPCSVRVAARLSLRRRGHMLRLHEARVSLAARRVRTLRLRLSRSGRAALRRTLQHRHRVRARVIVRARDRAGNLSRRSLLARVAG